MVKKQQKDLRKLLHLPNGNSVGQVKGDSLVKLLIGRGESPICSFSDFQERQKIEVIKKIANKNQNEIIADCLRPHNNGFTKEFSDKGTGIKSLHSRLETFKTANLLEVSDPYRPFVSTFSDITIPSLVDDSQKYVTIREAFLINDAGNVVSHAARHGANTLDEHIVGSMLSAVQAFVKDAFGDEESAETGLETLVYGNTRILIEHGELVFLVVVFSGAEPEGIREDLRKLLKKIEDKYYDVLKDWDGDLVKVKDITQIIQDLIFIRYRIGRGLRDIDLKSEKDRHKGPGLYIQGTHVRHEGIRQHEEYKGILQLLKTTSTLREPQTCIIAS